MGRLTLVVCGVLLTAVGVFADGVASLIGQLGHRDYHVREEASKKLADAGEAALPALTEATQSPVPEVSERAAGIVACIQRRLANDKALAGTTVQLDGGKQTLGELFTAIEKQSRYKLTINGDPAKLTTPVTTKAGKVPFWEAVRLACDAAGLTVEGVVGPLGPTVSTLRTGGRDEQVVAAAVEVLTLHRKARDHHREQLKRLNFQLGGADGDEKKRLMAQFDGEKRQFDKFEQKVTELEKRYGLAWYADAATDQVILHARPGKQPLPEWVSGAIRIVAEPTPDDTRKQYAKHHLPFTLKVYPEPRLPWQQVTETVVISATDQTGRDLRSSYFSPTTVTTLANDELQFRRARLGLRDGEPLESVGSPNTGAAALLAPAAGPPVTALKSVRGFLRAKVWTPADDVVVVKSLDAESTAAADGPNGTTLSVTVLDRGTVDFEVTVRYDPTQVRPDTVGRPSELAVKAEARGGVMVLRPESSADGWANPHGLTALDTAGNPFRLYTASTSLTEQWDGRKSMTVVRVRYQFQPATVGNRVQLAAVSFRASRLADVMAPFQMTDVPVSAGTGDGQPVVANGAWKK